MSASTLPQLPGFFHAILRVLAQNPAGLQRRDIREPVAEMLQLSPEQRAERLPSGGRRYRHRIGWSLNALKAAGYAESPASGIWRITPIGQERLAANPGGFSDATLRQISREARTATLVASANEIRRAIAVTLAGGIAFFHGTYEDPEGIYRWRLGGQNAERIGEHTGPLRGLSKGRFLSIGAAGYTILSLTDEVN